MADHLAPEAVGPRTPLFVVSKDVWTGFRSRVDNVIATTIASGGLRILLVDRAAVARLAATPETLPARQTRDIDLGRWLRDKAHEYRADEHAIAVDLADVGGSWVVAVDASAYDLGVLIDVMRHMRRVLFGAATWPMALVFIVREDALAQTLTVASGSFYLMPSRKSLREASAYAAGVHRAASYARLFGFSNARVARFFVATSYRFADALRRARQRDEGDRIA